MTDDASWTGRVLAAAPACGARHGIAAPRGLDPGAGARGGRFGRMFPALPACPLSDEAIGTLVAGMRGGRPAPNGLVPAGYTYLGQFIDHDITFDPQSSLERANDPHALVNFRTPRFDLDSLYGSGPADQPFLYDWIGSDPGVKLLVGHNRGDGEARVDLPRNEQGRALVGDARNDENLIVAQLHLLFIRFHNKVVDRLRHRLPAEAAGTLFEQAQRVVRWHYQWIVVHDFLAHIVGDDAYARLRARADGTATAAVRWLTAWREQPSIPVEFSGAAYRFGHSMVRDDYRAKRAGRSFPIFRRPGDDRLSFSGFRRLPSDLEIEWDLFFFDIPVAKPVLENLSMRIDTSLAAPLFGLPPDDAPLARLNLERGRALGLPSGPDVARTMGVTPLQAAQLDGMKAITKQAVADLQEMIDVLPLWVYVLLEAKVVGGKGTRLGPVGGGIVSEVLLGLLEADPSSYLHERGGWTPELSDGADGDFTMRDLVRYVEDPAWL